jgi:hypothetical protein
MRVKEREARERADEDEGERDEKVLVYEQERVDRCLRCVKLERIGRARVIAPRQTVPAAYSGAHGSASSAGPISVAS